MSSQYAIRDTQYAIRGSSLLPLVLAIACSIATAMLLKLVERRRMDRAVALAVNYGAALALALVLSAGGAGAPPDARVITLGTVTGTLFLAGYYVLGVAIRSAGVGLATGVMRLSVAVPVLGSWALYAEAPTTGQGAGLALAGAAFFLLARPAAPDGATGSRSAELAPGAGAMAVLGLLFAIGGAVDLAMKVFARSFGGLVEEAAFLVVVFGAATVLGIALVGVRWGRGVGTRDWRVVGVGVAIGVVNYGSAAFILRAAALLPAPLVFPTNAIAIVVGVALLAVVVWRERITRANVLGLALAVAALALLWGDRGGGV